LPPFRRHGRQRTWRRFLTGVAATLAVAAAALGVTGTAGAATVVEVSAGASHTCALLADGTVDCWGDNERGQLGDGTTTDSATPVKVLGLANATQVSAGGAHTCALLADGGVECWGNNDAGQLGDGTLTGIATPVAVSGLADATQVSAGGAHTCALLGDLTVECWGDDGSGQLGDGGVESQTTPVPVPGLEEVGAISAGWEHTCATHGDEASGVACWGSDGGRQLGDNLTTDSAMPVTVPGVTGAVGVGTGTLYSCALLALSEVECWGELNFEGETTEPNPTPVALAGVPTEIAVGAFHACALVGGAVECWGDDDGTLGEAEPNGEGEGELITEPVTVTGLTGAQQLSAGGNHTCAVVAGGAVECWGANEFGQLGDGATAASPLPVRTIFPEALPPPPSVGIQTAAAATEGQTTTPPPSGVPTPVFGKSVSLATVSGSVRVKLPGHRGFVPLAAASSFPLGTVVDTTGGTVELFAAAGPTAGTQSGRFDGGVFQIGQKLSTSPFLPGRVGLTVLTLTGAAPVCAAPRRVVARASGRGRGGNRLWGEDDHGNFQTGGRYASATVGGTRWLTAETCAGTEIKVAGGVVSVTDKARHRTVLLHAPHSYLARPAGGRR
jgi:alpha-tubulin suppressor-like RCC1 family protein